MLTPGIVIFEILDKSVAKYNVSCRCVSRGLLIQPPLTENFPQFSRIFQEKSPKPPLNLNKKGIPYPG